MTNDPSLDHQQHDPLLIAAHAAGDLAGAERDRAGILVRDCAECGTLAGDLEVLATAIHDLPAPVRSRGFTLSPADAGRLRRRRGWARVRDILRGNGFRLARPIGAGLASLGFAGLVFASTIGGVAPASPASETTGGAGALEEVLAPSTLTTPVDGDGTRAGAAAASPGTLDAQRQVVGEREGADAPDVAGEPTDAAGGETAAAASPNEALVVVSGSLFIVGIGLFGLRWTASRLPD